MTFKLSRRDLFAIAATAPFARAGRAQSAGRQVRVTFDDSHPLVRFRDIVVEFEIVTYAVSLRQGQELGIVLASNNAANCFDLYAPGVPKPVYVGGDSGNSHIYQALQSGDHLIKVFLLRLAARDGQTAEYELDLKLGVS